MMILLVLSLLLGALPLTAQRTGFPAADLIATENRTREESFFANSIDTATGAFIFERTLLTIQGGRRLIFDVACNSLANSGMGPLGRGCSHTYEARVDGDPEGVVTIHWDANRRNSFRFAGQGNDYEPLELTVLYDKLRREGQGWELTTLDGTVYDFDAAGNLQEVGNKIGQVLAMGYSDGLLTAIMEPLANKRISLTYRQDGSGLLQHLQDAENRIVFFSYNENRRLDGVRDPVVRGRSYGSNFSSIPIPDNEDAAQRPIDVDRTDPIGLVVLDALQINHPRPQDLVLTIESPSGTMVELTNERTLANWNLDNVILDQFEGEDPEGAWRVNVEDTAAGETGTLNTARLVFTDVTNFYPIAYNAAGQIAMIAGPEGGRIVANSYDSFGRVAAQEDGVDTNEPATFAYQETTAGVTTTYKDRTGAVSVLEYDRDYNFLSETDPLGHVKSFEYDSRGNRTVMTDELGRSWNYSYDAAGNVTSVRDPRGNTTTFEFDNRNNLTAVRDALGRESRFTYDSRNNLTKTTDSLPFGHQDNRSYSGSSQATGALLDDGGGVSFSYANGMPTTFSHPVSGQAGASYDRVGRVRSMTDGDGKTIRMTYDPRDLVIERQDQLGNISRFEYDARGRRIKETDPRGGVMLFEYDGNDRLVAVTSPLDEVMRYEYDGEDRVMRQIDPLGAVDVTVYDANGRVIAEIDPLGNEERVEYDAVGNVVAEYDAAGVATERTVFDDRDLPLRTEDALGAAIEIEYDEAERPVRVRDQLGDETLFEYDELDRPKASTDALSRETKRSYLEDDVTNRLEDSRGNGVTFGYDPANRMTRVQYPWGSSARFDYNNRDLLTEVRQPSGRELRIGYNNAGSMSFVGRSGGPLPEPDVFKTYDESGNLTEVETKLSTQTQRQADSLYEYDALNRVTRFTNVHGDVLEYEYDAAGNLDELTYPDGKTVRYMHDAAGRLVQVTDWADRVTVYEYDANGQVTVVSFPNGARREMEYDKKGQVTRRRDLSSTGAVIVDFRYFYDARGQMGVESSGVQRPPFRPQPVTMTYNSIDNRMATFNGQNVQYDADGNLTNGPLGDEFANFQYSAAGNLLQAGGMAYQYDAEDRLVGFSEGGILTRLTVDEHAEFSQVLVKTETPNRQTRYVWGLGLIYEETEGGIRVHHYDHRGSTIAFSNDAGGIVGSVTYGPFGEIGERSGDSESLFQFSALFGVITDPNGLSYMRFRWYSPRMRRFLTPDALFGDIDEAGSLNRYAFAGNNPITRTDPDGQLWNIVAGAAAGAAIAAASDLIIDGKLGPPERYIAAAGAGAAIAACYGVCGFAGFVAAGAIGGGSGGLYGSLGVDLIRGDEPSADDALQAGKEGAIEGAISGAFAYAFGGRAAKKAASNTARSGGRTAGRRAAQRGAKSGGRRAARRGARRGASRRASVVLERQPGKGAAGQASRVRARNPVPKNTTRTVRARPPKPKPTGGGRRVRFRVKGKVVSGGGRPAAPSSGPAPGRSSGVARTGGNVTKTLVARVAVNAGRKGVYGEHRHYQMYLGALTNAGRPAPNNPQLGLPTF